MGLLALVLYVSAVLATKLFGPVAPGFFGDLGSSLFTSFQVMTVEGWPDIARAVMVHSAQAWIFFVAHPAPLRGSPEIAQMVEIEVLEGGRHHIQQNYIAT